MQILFLHAQYNHIECFVFGRKANVLGGERFAFAFAEIAHLDRRRFGRWTFAENFPRARAEYTFFVHVHPRGDALQHGFLLVINRAVATNRNVQQQITVFTDDVGQHSDHSLRTLIHQSRKETSAAIDCYHKALKAQPDWPESLNNLAWILAANPDASLRNGAEAVALAERACKLTGYKEGIFVGTLAAAYAEAGRFQDAVNSAEKAHSLALAAGQKELAQKNQELLELYRAGHAYHEAQ